MAPNEFMGGGAALFMVLPFLFIGVGLLYMAFAAGDRRNRPRNPQVRVLPVGAQHPLSHVRAKMKPAAPAQAPREAQQKPERKRRSEPPWLSQV